MAKDSTRSGRGGTTTTPAATGPFSWQGATTPSTFQPKDFGTKLFGDVGAAYKQGPQPLIPSYTPFSSQTSNLIDRGLTQVNANAGGPLSDYASGKFLNGGNPYLQNIINQTNDQTSQDVNSTFASNGRFGSDIHAQGLGTALANADNNLRYQDYQNEFGNMLGAQNALNSNTAQGLGLSGLLDSKAQELTASNREQQQAADPFNYVSKYLGLLNSGTNAQNTNQPTSIWDILGGIGSIAGKFL